MAETVQYYLERMVPEIKDLEEREIFTKVCVERAGCYCQRQARRLIT